MKKTAIAPSNLALIKYWGRRNDKLRLPANSSISVNLDGLVTKTTVEFSKEFVKDKVVIDGKEEEASKKRVIKHLDRIRKRAGVSLKAKVKSENNFPSSTGLSSSASGFAALTLAASSALGLKLSIKELSVLARKASGSACRSIPDGFVEWKKGRDDNSSYATSFCPPSWWGVFDVVVILSTSSKSVPTSSAHKLAYTSLFFPKRLSVIEKKVKEAKQLIKERNFSPLGELIEQEALELHAIMITSKPSLIYLLPETIDIIAKVIKWRKEGLEVCFTINTGQNIHLICQEKDLSKLQKKLKEQKSVKKTIVNRPSKGARLTSSHLF